MSGSESMTVQHGFHAKEGWYFERMTDEKYGWVKITCYRGSSIQKDHWQEESKIEIEIEPNMWASIIASVCPEGGTGYTFNLASAFHGVLPHME